MPEVLVDRVRLGRGHRHRDAMPGGVRELVLPRLQRPLPPRRDDGHLRCERAIGQLESHLVVALAGTAMRERVATGLLRHFDLDFRDEWPRERGPEEIPPLVHGSRAKRREDVVPNELVADVDYAALDRAARERLLLDGAEVFDLAHVDHDRDHLAAVVLPKPRDDDGGVETPRVRESDFSNVQAISLSFAEPAAGATAPSAASRISIAASTSAGVTTSGGAKRSVFGRTALTRRPRSRHASTTGPASISRSAPTSSPAPRISPTTARFARSSSRPATSRAPQAPAFSRSPSLSIASSTAQIAADASALPPNVEPWSPGTKCDAASSVARTTPAGTPPATPLASVTTSGRIPAAW